MLTILLIAASCESAKYEAPEVTFRHCLLDQARQSGSVPTYDQATHFAASCTRYARRAAVDAVERELGLKFDPQTYQTVKLYRETRISIEQAHVCAIASDNRHCDYIGDLSELTAFV